VALIVGCAGSAEVWGDTESGLILEYRMPEMSMVSYKFWSNTTENVEVMGQSMEVKTISSMLFSATTKGIMEKMRDLSIMIDSSYLSITSPRGELTGDMTNVIGKSFGMQLSHIGKEMNLTGTEEIEYDLGPAGTRNGATSFAAIFPNMAGKPVKMGESWPTLDTVQESGGGMNVLVAVDAVNTLDGLTSFQGYECARIVGVFTGTIHGEGTQGPMELVTDGTMKGKDTTYFAYKEGFLVQNIAHGIVEAVTEATGPQNMTIPSTREMIVGLRLTKGPAPMAK
jgi:hypothetical protein